MTLVRAFYGICRLCSQHSPFSQSQSSHVRARTTDGRAWLNDPDIGWYVSILYSDHNCWEEAPYLLASA